MFKWLLIWMIEWMDERMDWCVYDIQMCGYRDENNTVTSFRIPSPLPEGTLEHGSMNTWIEMIEQIKGVLTPLTFCVTTVYGERIFQMYRLSKQASPHWLTGAEAAFPPFVWWEVCVRALYSHVTHGSNSRGSKVFNYTNANQRKHHTCGSWHVLYPSHPVPFRCSIIIGR